ncbi:hypothetical protein LTR28_002449, partial [Elasticomyces elasticus]
GAGKTQLLLTLLLSAQLPCSRSASALPAPSTLYISTEAPLPTIRLTHLLASHPSLYTLPDDTKPTLSRILSIRTQDLESQEHILRYQLPVALARHNIRLVVIDSIAANFRAEFDKSGDRNGGGGAHAMARRSAQLVQLGALLRDLAHRHNVAIVVANQVADRFTTPTHLPTAPPRHPSTTTTTAQNSQPRSPRSAHSTPSHPSSAQTHCDNMSKPGLASQQSHPGATLLSEDPLALDHQQRWISGWGDSLRADAGAMKTPSLGLAWSKQVAARVALLKRPVYKNGTDASSLGVVGEGGGGGGGGEKEIVGWA